MGQDILLESEFIKRFILKDKQERYLNQISGKASRKKFIGELAHFKDLNLVKFDKIDRDIERVIKQRVSKFENCYIISENAELDATIEKTETALSRIIGYGMGTLLIFGKAEFAYYEGEERNDRWLSK